jgi:hypothetical protein
LENGLGFHADSMMDGGGGVGLGQDTGSRWREKLTRGPRRSAAKEGGGAIPIRCGRLAGLGPLLGLGQLVSERPFPIFIIFFSFSLF